MAVAHEWRVVSTHGLVRIAPNCDMHHASREVALEEWQAARDAFPSERWYIEIRMVGKWRRDDGKAKA